MPSSYTTSLRLTLPATGELAGSWGSTVNTGVTALAEAAIAGTSAVAMTDANYTLTALNGAADQARSMFITLTGTLTAARNVICPSVSKMYVVTNSTTGGQTITFKTSAGTGIAVASGQRRIVYCDGVNVLSAISAPATAAEGGTGQTSYAIGDLLYASTTTSLSKLADVATGNALISGGVGVAPSWGKIGLTTHVSGTLPVANGGTGVTTSTGSGSNVLSTSPTLTTPTLGAATITSINGGQIAGMRNRIINGQMLIDQRNSGATVLNSGYFVVDRWADSYAGSGRYSAGQSTVAPTGFGSSLLHTVTTAVSPAATDVYQIFQSIEAYNTADFAFGTAGATSITLSFWVRSSITGTYAVSFRNHAPGTSGRVYVSTYTINVANTWEQKTISIPGDTTGSWLNNTNGTGLTVNFDLGSGSNQNTTAGIWQTGVVGNERRRTSGCVSWIATAGATFYLTGVQLEVGSVATPFEQRSYGTELALCQRYYQNLSYGQSTGQFYSTTAARLCWALPVTMRAAPTLSIPTLTAEAVGSGATTFSGNANIVASVNAVYFDGTGASPARTQFQQAVHNSLAYVTAEL